MLHRYPLEIQTTVGHYKLDRPGPQKFKKTGLVEVPDALPG